MDMFYTVHGCNTKYKTEAEAIKQANKYCVGSPGADFYVMQSYAAVEIPLAAATVTKFTPTTA